MDGNAGCRMQLFFQNLSFSFPGEQLDRALFSEFFVFSPFFQVFPIFCFFRVENSANIYLLNT